MMDFFNNLFAPLGREYCVIYYYLSLIALFAFVLTLMSVFYLFVKGKYDTLLIFNAISLLTSTLLSYYLNRLMYTICVTSLSK